MTLHSWISSSPVADWSTASRSCSSYQTTPRVDISDAIHRLANAASVLTNEIYYGKLHALAGRRRCSIRAALQKRFDYIRLLLPQFETHGVDLQRFGRRPVYRRRPWLRLNGESLRRKIATRRGAHE